VSIDSNLYIMSNDSLVDISGLENLSSDISGLWVADNLNLNTLVGLGNIVSIGVDGVLISDNPMLSTCNIESICDHLRNERDT